MLEEPPNNPAVLDEDGNILYIDEGEEHLMDVVIEAMGRTEEEDAEVERTGEV